MTDKVLKSFGQAGNGCEGRYPSILLLTWDIDRPIPWEPTVLIPPRWGVSVKPVQTPLSPQMPLGIISAKGTNSWHGDGCSYTLYSSSNCTVRTYFDFPFKSVTVQMLFELQF